MVGSPTSYRISLYMDVIIIDIGKSKMKNLSTPKQRIPCHEEDPQRIAFTTVSDPFLHSIKLNLGINPFLLPGDFQTSEAHKLVQLSLGVAPTEQSLEEFLNGDDVL